MHTAALSRMLQSERVLSVLPENLSAALADAIRSRKGQRSPTNSASLLGGIARCGECGRGMGSASTRGGRPQGRWFSYACRDSHAAISGRWLDQYVSEAVIAAVDTGRLLEAIRRRQKVGQTRKASELEARLELLERDHYDGKMPRARFERHRDRLLEQLAKAHAAERDVGADLPVELARDLGKTWPHLTVQARRRVVSAVLRQVEVGKATLHGKLDAGRVKLVWR